MVDIHAHILPGLDDGSESLEESLDMARLAVEEGITHMIATSHGNFYDYTLQEYREAFRLVSDALEQERIPLRLHPGMEIFLNRHAIDGIRDGSLLPLGNTHTYLVEFDFGEDPRTVLTMLESLLRDEQAPDRTLILAHPERYEFMLRDPDLAYYLRETWPRRLYLQTNAGSLAGRLGQAEQRLAWRFLQDGLIQLIATDAHDASFRPPALQSLTQSLQREYSETDCRIWLSENPSRVLKGRELII